MHLHILHSSGMHRTLDADHARDQHAALSTGSCVLQAAYGYLLGQVGDALEVMPGEEFRVAVQEASKASILVCSAF